MTTTELLDALRKGQAAVTTRVTVRYGITKTNTDYPAIFLTIDDEGYPVGNDDENYFVDEHGDETPLSDADEQEIADALSAYIRSQQ